jgi:hypothetical protein
VKRKVAAMAAAAEAAKTAEAPARQKFEADKVSKGVKKEKKNNDDDDDDDDDDDSDSDDDDFTSDAMTVNAISSYLTK